MARNNSKISIWKFFLYPLVSTWSIFALISCTNSYYNGQCSYPEAITDDTLFGKWQLEYSNFHVSHFGHETIINGREEIVLNKDGTYAQVFVSDEYNYVSTGVKQWELITNTPDSPKIKLYGMKYFAYGIESANNASQLVLDPQTTDSQKNQDAREKGVNILNTSITYPDDGYIYLYPRLCSDQISLLQMVVRPRDPDNLTILNPVFTRFSKQAHFHVKVPPLRRGLHPVAVAGLPDHATSLGWVLTRDRQ